MKMRSKSIVFLTAIIFLLTFAVPAFAVLDVIHNGGGQGGQGGTGGIGQGGQGGAGGIGVGTGGNANATGGTGGNATGGTGGNATGGIGYGGPTASNANANANANSNVTNSGNSSVTGSGNSSLVIEGDEMPAGLLQTVLGQVSAQEAFRSPIISVMMEFLEIGDKVSTCDMKLVLNVAAEGAALGLEAKYMLGDKGIYVTVLGLSTDKPMNPDMIRAVAIAAIIRENHSMLEEIIFQDSDEWLGGHGSAQAFQWGLGLGTTQGELGNPFAFNAGIGGGNSDTRHNYDVFGRYLFTFI